MVRQAKNSINLYEGYKQLVTREKSDKSRRAARLIAPLVLVAVVLLAFAGSILVKNMRKARELAAIDKRIEALTPAHTHALEVSQRCDDLESRYSALAFNRMLFDVYPALNQDLVAQVRDCARDGEIFTINAYGYDEEDMTLVVNAYADSVNEVPMFVERLRDTRLFSGVHYTGYTSDQTEIYFCTVGCTLTMNGEYALDEEDAEDAVTATAELNMTEDDDAEGVSPENGDGDAAEG